MGAIISMTAAASTPSLFAAPYDRILVDCTEVPSAHASTLCAAVSAELGAGSNVPVVIGDQPAPSDIVVNVRAQAGQRDDSLEVGIWLSRPVGRTGEPSVKPARTVILQLNEKGQLANPRLAVRDTLQAVFATRRFAHVPSPPRAQ